MKKDSLSVGQSEVKLSRMNLSFVDLWKQREDDTQFCRVGMIKWGTGSPGGVFPGEYYSCSIDYACRDVLICASFTGEVYIHGRQRWSPIEIYGAMAAVYRYGEEWAKCVNVPQNA